MRQRIQPTGTNRPRAWFELQFYSCSLWSSRGDNPLDNRFPVALAAGSHPFPFRTRQLSPPAPMVLGERSPGRVGRRRISHGACPRMRGHALVLAVACVAMPEPARPPRPRAAGPTMTPAGAVDRRCAARELALRHPTVAPSAGRTARHQEPVPGARPRVAAAQAQEAARVDGRRTRPESRSLRERGPGAPSSGRRPAGAAARRSAGHATPPAAPSVAAAADPALRPGRPAGTGAPLGVAPTETDGAVARRPGSGGRTGTAGRVAGGAASRPSPSSVGPRSARSVAPLLVPRGRIARTGTASGAAAPIGRTSPAGRARRPGPGATGAVVRRRPPRSRRSTGVPTRASVVNVVRRVAA